MLLDIIAAHNRLTWDNSRCRLHTSVTRQSGVITMSNAKKKNMKPANNVIADKAKSSQYTPERTASNAASDTVAKATQAAAQNMESAVKSTSHLSAIDSNVNTPDQMVQAGAAAVKDFIAAGTQEAQKTQQKVMSLGNESLQNWSKTADQAVRSLNDALALSKEQLDAVMESSKIATDLSRELHEKFVAECNDLFSENVELSKNMLECRTLNDLVEIQNRALQSNLSRFFDQGANFTEAWFRLATEASEPLSAQANQVTSRMKRTLAA